MHIPIVVLFAVDQPYYRPGEECQRQVFLLHRFNLGLSSDAVFVQKTEVEEFYKSTSVTRMSFVANVNTLERIGAYFLSLYASLERQKANLAVDSARTVISIDSISVEKAYELFLRYQPQGVKTVNKRERVVREIKI